MLKLIKQKIVENANNCNKCQWKMNDGGILLYYKIREKLRYLGSKSSVTEIRPHHRQQITGSLVGQNKRNFFIVNRAEGEVLACHLCHVVPGQPHLS